MKGTVMEKRKSDNRIRFHAADAAAAAVFLALAAFLLFSAFRNVNVAGDEDLYPTIPLRVLGGDRFVVDEWEISQLSGLFLLLPCRLFLAVTGGTEGIILYLRLIHLAAVLIFFWYFYLKLRNYGCPWVGLAASGLFTLDNYLGCNTLNYYNMCIHALLLTGMILFLGGKKPPFKLIFAGAVFACAVLNQPTIIVVYLLWSLLTLLRELRLRRGKKDPFPQWGFALGGREWLWTTVGAAGVAAVFFSYLLSTAGLGNIIEALPGLSGSAEYSSPILFKDLIWQSMKVPWAIEHYGAVNFALLIAVGLAAVVYDAKAKKTGGNKKIKTAIFLLSQAVFLSCFVVSFLKLSPTNVTKHAASPEYGRILTDYFSLLVTCLLSGCMGPVCFSALVAYLLCEKKDRGVFAFWILGAACSLFVDTVSCATIVFGGRLMYLPAVYFTAQFLGELRGERTTAEKSEKRTGRPVLRAAAGCLAAVMLFCCVSFLGFQLTFAYRIDYPVRTDREHDVFSYGPYKGLIRRPELIGNYELLHRDLDFIKQNCNGRVYVATLFPYAYLYMQLPMGIYSALYSREDSRDRWTLYWTLQPDKRPEYIYLPTVSDDAAPDEDARALAEENLAFLRTVADFELTNAPTGYILKMTDWHLQTTENG